MHFSVSAMSALKALMLAVTASFQRPTLLAHVHQESGPTPTGVLDGKIARQESGTSQVGLERNTPDEDVAGHVYQMAYLGIPWPLMEGHRLTRHLCTLGAFIHGAACNMTREQEYQQGAWYILQVAQQARSADARASKVKPHNFEH